MPDFDAEEIERPEAEPLPGDDEWWLAYDLAFRKRAHELIRNVPEELRVYGARGTYRGSLYQRLIRPNPYGVNRFRNAARLAPEPPSEPTEKRSHEDRP